MGCADGRKGGEGLSGCIVGGGEVPKGVVIGTRIKREDLKVWEGEGGIDGGREDPGSFSRAK